MTSFILTNAQITLGTRDISGISNSISIDYRADLVETSDMAGNTKRRRSGLRNASITINGFADNDFDGDFFSSIGRAEANLQVIPHTGGPTFTFPAIAGRYSRSASVGEIFRFTYSLQSRGTPTRVQ